MSNIRLFRVILALVLLQLSCSSQHVEAKSRFKHASRYRHAWSWPSQNLWNWLNLNPPAPSSDSSPRPPQIPSPASPAPAAPAMSLPPPSPSLAPAPLTTQLPPQPSASPQATSVQISSLAPAPLATQVPPQPSASPPAPPAQISSLPVTLSTTQLSPQPSLLLPSSPAVMTTLAAAPSATLLPPQPSSSPLASPVQFSSNSPAPLATPLPVTSDAPLSTSSFSPGSLATSSLPAASTPYVSASPTPVLTSSTFAPAPTASVSSAAANKTTAGCSNPRVRPEWRSLSRQQQANYITAVKCLAKLPSKLLPGGDYRRYDDFENVHSRMRTKIHWMSIFLPWHRHFMFLYEQALRNECGYTGSLPRWDWTLDSQDMTKSPIWSADPIVGFGSNGQNFTDVDSAIDGGVVADGAFANWDLYYPEYHQLQRNYNLPSQFKVAGRSWGSQYFDQASMNKVQSQSTYPKFAVALEGTDPSSTGPSNPGPHSIIHVIVGGDISPTSYAANEPLFYLHHTNVDYHWWRWQNAQRSTRLYAYGGPTVRGSTQDTARLTDGLKYLSLGPDVQVQDVMDTYSAKYCYTY